MTTSRHRTRPILATWMAWGVLCGILVDARGLEAAFELRPLELGGGALIPRFALESASDEPVIGSDSTSVEWSTSWLHLRPHGLSAVNVDAVRVSAPAMRSGEAGVSRLAAPGYREWNGYVGARLLGDVHLRADGMWTHVDTVPARTEGVGTISSSWRRSWRGRHQLLVWSSDLIRLGSTERQGTAPTFGVRARVGLFDRLDLVGDRRWHEREGGRSGLELNWSVADRLAAGYAWRSRGEPDIVWIELRGDGAQGRVWASQVDGLAPTFGFSVGISLGASVRKRDPGHASEIPPHRFVKLRTSFEERPVIETPSPWESEWADSFWVVSDSLERTPANPSILSDSEGSPFAEERLRVRDPQTLVVSKITGPEVSRRLGIADTTAAEMIQELDAFGIERVSELEKLYLVTEFPKLWADLVPFLIDEVRSDAGSPDSNRGKDQRRRDLVGSPRLSYEQSAREDGRARHRFDMETRSPHERLRLSFGGERPGRVEWAKFAFERGRNDVEAGYGLRASRMAVGSGGVGLRKSVGSVFLAIQRDFSNWSFGGGSDTETHWSDLSWRHRFGSASLDLSWGSETTRVTSLRTDWSLGPERIRLGTIWRGGESPVAEAEWRRSQTSGSFRCHFLARARRRISLESGPGGPAPFERMTLAFSRVLETRISRARSRAVVRWEWLKRSGGPLPSHAGSESRRVRVEMTSRSLPDWFCVVRLAGTRTRRRSAVTSTDPIGNDSGGFHGKGSSLSQSGRARLRLERQLQILTLGMEFGGEGTTGRTVSGAYSGRQAWWSAVWVGRSVASFQLALGVVDVNPRGGVLSLTPSWVGGRRVSVRTPSLLGATRVSYERSMLSLSFRGIFPTGHSPGSWGASRSPSDSRFEVSMSLIRRTPRSRG